MSFSWTTSGTPAVDFKEIRISRYVDGNSPFYIAATTSQQSIAFLQVTRGSMRVRMENARVAAYSIGATSPTDPQVETLDVVFDRVTVSVSGTSYCYDVVAGSAC